MPLPDPVFDKHLFVNLPKLGVCLPLSVLQTTCETNRLPLMSLEERPGDADGHGYGVSIHAQWAGGLSTRSPIYETSDAAQQAMVETCRTITRALDERAGSVAGTLEKFQDAADICKVGWSILRSED